MVFSIFFERFDEHLPHLPFFKFKSDFNTCCCCKFSDFDDLHTHLQSINAVVFSEETVLLKLARVSLQFAILSSLREKE